MRFKLRFQSEWPQNLNLVWGLALLALTVAALALGSHRLPRWIPSVQLLCCVLSLVSSPFGYCQFGPDGLLLRRRGRKTLIPCESLVELKARTDAYGVLAVTDTGRRIPVPVAQTPEFLREAYRRFPRLNPASASLSFALM
jgi:hypothetical protein